MFEKEAEEWRKSLNYRIDNDTFYNIVIPCMEFGYNKANEWHYVKDGDLPKENQKCYFIHSNTYDESNKVSFEEGFINVLTGVYSFFYDDEGYETTEPCFYDDINDEEIDLKEVYAWKEIVLPELKENE